VMAAIAKAVITCKNLQKKEVAQLWFWWIEILILSV
jgi:hypothetical protein